MIGSSNRDIPMPAKPAEDGKPQGHAHRTAHRARRLGLPDPIASAISGATAPHRLVSAHSTSPNSETASADAASSSFAEARDEHHINRIGQHLQQIGERERRRQRSGGAQFLPPAGRIGMMDCVA
jgi:hypothetical protein